MIDDRDRGFQERQRIGGLGGKEKIERPALQRIAGTFVTFHLVTFAWIFFQADSIADALLLVRGLGQIGAQGDLTAPWASLVSDPGLELALSLGLIALLVAVYWLRTQAPRLVSSVERRAWVRWAIYLLLALAILNLGMAREASFIYFQF